MEKLLHIAGRASLFIVAGVVLTGGSFLFASGDIAYNADALLAAVWGAFPGGPSITISRNSSAPSSSVVPGRATTLAIFDVSTRRLSGTTTIEGLPLQITIKNDQNAVAVRDVYIDYNYCRASGGAYGYRGYCSTQRLYPSSVVRDANSYRVIFGQPIIIYTDQTSASFIVKATPYYVDPPAGAGATANVAVSVTPGAVARSEECRQIRYGYLNKFGYKRCTTSYPSLSASTGYGSAIPLARGYGYGYYNFTVAPGPRLPDGVLQTGSANYFSRFMLTNNTQDSVTVRGVYVDAVGNAPSAVGKVEVVGTNSGYSYGYGYLSGGHVLVGGYLTLAPNETKLVTLVGKAARDIRALAGNTIGLWIQKVTASVQPTGSYFPLRSAQFTIPRVPIITPTSTSTLLVVGDPQRKQDIQDIAAALRAYYVVQGTYVVSGGGYGGGGQGWVAYEGPGYPKAATRVLYEQGYLTRLILESTPTYMLYTCGASFAVSAKLDNPSAADIQKIQSSCNGTGANGTYSAYGRNYAVTQSIVVPPPPPISPPLAPTVSLTANGQHSLSITPGTQYTIAWSSTNAASCSVTWNGTYNGTPSSGTQAWPTSGGGPTALIGSYTITCTNSAGMSVSDSVTITAASVPPPPPPRTAGPTPEPIPTVTLTANGQKSIYVNPPNNYTLAWSSTGAASCTMSWNRTDGATPATGTQNWPTNGSGQTGLLGTYTFSCKNSGGQAASDTVSIQKITVNPFEER